MTAFIVAHAALWPVLVPLTGAGATACLRSRRGAQRATASVSVVLMLASALLLLGIVQQHGIQVIRFGGWAPPFGVVFAVDALGAAMAAVTGLIGVATLVFGVADVRHRDERAGYYPLLLGLLAGVNGAFLTGDLFNLYVWFELMLIAAMALLVVRRTRAQLDGTFRYAVLNLLSTLLFLTGVAVLYGSTGTLNMADLAAVVSAQPPSPSLAIAAALLLCGFGIKAGVFPLFFWLPASYHTGSIAITALFAGLLTKVGIYASFRVFTLIFPIDVIGLREVMAGLAACTMLFGVFGAMVQWDVRRILAFHIVSQIGYMLMGLAIATPAALAGAIFYVVHHILVKANLFLVAGLIHRACGSYDLRRAGGLMAASPILTALFLVPALSLAGVPPLSGFWAKLLVIDASFRSDQAWLGGIALLVGLLTLFSMSKIWIEGFWRPAAGRQVTRGLPLPMLAASGLLAVVTIAFSVWPEPLVAYAANAAAALANPDDYVAAVLHRDGSGAR